MTIAWTANAQPSWIMEQEFQRDRARARRTGDLAGWQTVSLIYADWLEERGRDTDAAALRRHAERKAVPPTRWPGPAVLAAPALGLSEHQQYALGEALLEPVGVLVGTPGVGKTYVLGRLVRALVEQRLGPIAVCAPTGKAAVRITQAIAEAGIDDVRGTAFTIHQLLGIGRNGHDGDGWSFLHNADNPLNVKVVIVDEASMLDAYLAASLFAALKPGTHVLLVGDPDQLPPVGHGAVLRDLITAGVPCGRLTEVHRNGGMIVEACAAIRRGDPLELADSLDVPSGRNLRHIEAAGAAEVRDYLLGVVDRVRAQRNVRTDLQVICPVNERGPLARKALNTALQQLLSTPHVGDHHGYRVGDKVLCVKNGWYPPVVRGDALEYVANGETGVVTSLIDNSLWLEFDSPRRALALPVVNSESQAVANFSLGWAITGHKSQGSQWPVVVVVVDDSGPARQIAGREWWYTVISRASVACITIGRRDVLEQQVRRGVLGRRKTLLVELMRGGLERC